MHQMLSIKGANISKINMLMKFLAKKKLNKFQSCKCSGKSKILNFTDIFYNMYSVPRLLFSIDENLNSTKKNSI